MNSTKQSDGHKHTLVPHILAIECGLLKVVLRLCLFQGAFPARLKKVLIVGAPVWFRVPYNLLSLLLKEKLRERVSREERWRFPSTNPCVC